MFFKKTKAEKPEILLRSLGIHKKIPKKQLKNFINKSLNEKTYITTSLKNKEMLFVSDTESRPLEILLEKLVNNKSLILLDIYDDITKENKIYVCYHMTQLKDIKDNLNQNFKLEIPVDDDNVTKIYNHLIDNINGYLFSNPYEENGPKIYFYTNDYEKSTLYKVLLNNKKEFSKLEIKFEEIQNIYKTRTEAQNNIRKATNIASSFGVGLILLFLVNMYQSNSIDSLNAEKTKINKIINKKNKDISIIKKQLKSYENIDFNKQIICN